MVVNFKCPNCGASLNYSEGTQSMSCPYCNTKIDISDLAGKYDDEDGETAGEDESADGEAAGEGSAGQEEVSQFKCENCGGALITDRYTAATICPYCGSPSVIKSRISGRNKPTLLIPFNINKNQAREVFRKWVRSGLFTPRVFAKSTVLDSIIGLYVPYWLFDYEVSSHMEAAATRVRTERRGDYEYTYTDHYLLEREAESKYRRIPVDASEEMPDDTMERLEPFDYKQIRSFDIPYLSGFYAERSNFDPSALEGRAKERASDSIYQETRNTMYGFSSVYVNNSSVKAVKTSEEYAMFPVWILQYRYKNRDWKLYLNGETGRKIGKLPVSVWKAGLCFLVSGTAFSALIALVWKLILLRG